MSRASTLILLGILTLVTPFSGLPELFRTVCIVVFAASISGIGLAMRLADVRAVKTAMPQSPEREVVQEIAPKEVDDHQSPQKFSAI